MPFSFFGVSTFTQTVLPSVRTLELGITYTDHYQIRWLNLINVLPKLQEIFLDNFHCYSCNISSDTFQGQANIQRFHDTVSCLNFFTACLYKSLPRNLIHFRCFDNKTFEEMFISSMNLRQN